MFKADTDELIFSELGLWMQIRPRGAGRFVLTRFISYISQFILTFVLSWDAENVNQTRMQSFRNLINPHFIPNRR